MAIKELKLNTGTDDSISKEQTAAVKMENGSKVMSDGTSVTYESGTVVFDEGDHSDYAYIILEGVVELSKNRNGVEVHMAKVGPGGLFGEMGLIDGSNRSARATCLKDTVLKPISSDELMHKLRNDSEFAAPVLNQLVSELRQTSNRLAHETSVSLQRAAESAEIVKSERNSVMNRLKGFFNSDQDLVEFQPDAVEIERQKVPAVAKLLLYVILGLVIGAFVWASFATIETAVSSTGRITTEVPNIVVQPSDTAQIREIHVEVGDYVEKGQLLATLDATLAEADVNVSKASLTSLLAKERRLEAELAGERPAEGFSNDPAEDALQNEIFERRMTSITKTLASIDEQIKQSKADIRTTAQDAKDLAEQAGVLREMETMRKKLMDDGYGSRVNYLSAKHQRLSIDREERQLTSSLSRLERQLKGLQADRAAMLANWETQIAEQLAEVRRERDRTGEQVKKTEYVENLVRLTAPAEGTVLKIAERSVGSVIKQAEPMFVIVPANIPLEMEVDVQPKDVGLIQVGDFVRIKLDALPFQKHGHIEGQVRLISEDAVEKEGGKATETVYRTRIELKDEKLRNVPESFRMTPGLTGSADITVGKREVITYFIYPLVRALDSSFREP